MTEREYIVTLHKDVDYTAFNQEMIAETGGGDIPQRIVGVENARPASQRNTHYALTDDEAQALRNDSRVLDVQLPPEVRTDIQIGLTATQTGTFNKSTSDSGEYYDWGKIRHSIRENQYGTGTTTSATMPYVLDGHGVDVVIQDSGLQIDHPEFIMENTSDYISTTLAANSTNGAVFDRQVTVHGLKLVPAGAVGGQSAVPDDFSKKVAQVVKLLIDPTGTHINLTQQKNLIATLKGDAGTFHAGMPTAQRIGNSAGSSYSPNWLTDAGIPSYAGYQTFLDSHVANDMVWYNNASGPSPTTQDSEIEEVMEHLFHTIHLFGLPGATPGSATGLNWLATNAVGDSWKTTELHLAMSEAIAASKFDPSDYAPSWATNTEQAEIAYKEYMYLLNWGMWGMSEFWNGDSLAPEWTDDMRTPAGIRTNNPQGYQLFKKYFMPVLSKPSFTTLKSIFKGNDQGNENYLAHTGFHRVHQINWADESGISFTQNTNHYRDTDGHGTHVAGTAVGKTYGWAKNARIFSVKVGGLEGTGDSNTGISVSNCFDIIKNWHNAKEADPLTGVKRPTIVNMSWGYSSNVGNSISNITSIVYRGTTYNSGSDGSFGQAAHMWSTYGFATYYSSGAYRFPIRVASVDTDVDELIAAGVHVCIAAGNNSFKADVSGGDDYNNIVFANNGVTANYHRGSSPYSDDAFMVGCADATPTNATTERKVSFSTTGPGVNIYAAGHNIISCTSQTNRFGDAVYYGSSSWRQCNISGTSMASPQVAGVGATYLQTEPGLTPAQLKSKIETDSLAILNTASDLTNYEDTDDLVGGPNRFMLSRYGKTQTFSSNIKGLVVK